jgi:hypothetical protein
MVAKFVLLLSTIALPTSSFRVDSVNIQEELLNSSENAQPSPLRWIAKRMEESMGWPAGTLAAPNLKKRLAFGEWFGVKGGGHQSTDTKWLFNFEITGSDLDVSAHRFQGSTRIDYNGKINANYLHKGKQGESGYWYVRFSIVKDSGPSSSLDVALRIYSLAQCVPRDLDSLRDVEFQVQGDS